MFVRSNTASSTIRIVLTVFVLLTICIWAYSAVSPVRDKRLRTVIHDGRERSFVVHVPPQYDGKKVVPLVIVMHGGGGNAWGTERMTGFSEKADKEGFIAVYPNGTGRFRYRLLTWNAAENCCGYAFDHKIDDVGFIREMIERLEKDYSIDSKRIYATGMSNGAMMAYRLGSDLSDKIAAIAPVAGAMNFVPKPKHPVSAVIFNGTADEHVRYEGGEPIKRADWRHPRVDRSVASAVATWVKHNGCKTNPRKEERGSVIKETYTGGRGGSEIVLYTIKGEGHTWPGGEKWARRADEPTKELSATDAMWEFFEKHPN